jgi:hypothetical protein
VADPRKLTAYALSAALLLANGGAAFAQTTTGGNTAAGGNTTTSTTTEGSGAGNMNRAGGDQSGFDWGWLGLLGLIGLAGLMRRDHAQDRHHRLGATR